MTFSFILSGFGGQGVMLMGQILAQAGMQEAKNVTWFPSYGPEMRGGTANCTVVISDEPVASPIVDSPDVVVAMNIPSLLKFEPRLKKNGFLFLNTSVIDRKATRNDIRVIEVPANEIADRIGNLKVANMVMLGAIIAVTKCVRKDSVVSALQYKLGEKGSSLLKLNIEAIEAGIKHVGG
ncbi:MAG: Pyruvate/ketoisovalerate oxidoreductase, gamma subunit [Thermotoga sp. 50_1627]|uniref:2-oxoacid:acceptor oxidoreductase family protein n=1 Tax=Pseudothermotoga sp. TaxID=2033661 RepID=UPI00076DD4F5|nr:MAG: Pyruvate/ketoisovalerate oxidoreductase, gamma subunit [Thermotoga sp. 50_64]KUK25786.1 MAG: Pyruvate/ketoisovalerate oxidoreductase, gamma subunit [Thermotoga sp. 50_1627]MBC7115470.1 2-oxoacid:acceptor oxidoreductase family protein [Pseudothermotoga sp.]MDK2922859.1 2-oxoglutarate ferredoxin oxidoreductase subunit gamma [Pseudothermotoga sp.]HBT40112.1 2-oxoacid:ferredoxin oxidoreductase subunit gamma [Pseudothermotoga sp.]